MQRRSILVTLLAFCSSLLAGCPGNNPPTPGKLQTPIFEALNVPGATHNSFVPSATTVQPLKVLPVRDGVVQIKFSAPFGMVFSVSARATGSSTSVQLPQDTPSGAGGGFFKNVSETATRPADYVIQVQLPDFLTLPAPFPGKPNGVDILVVNSSVRTDQTDSDPMIVSLAPAFSTVTLTVNGPGHVQSQFSIPGQPTINAPPGILCGISSLGHNLLTCTFDFPPGTLTLAPNSRDNQVDHFDGWASGCPTDPHLSCVLTIDGINNPAPLTAVFSGP